MSDKERDLSDTIASMQGQITTNFVLIQALIELLKDNGVDHDSIVAKYEEIYGSASEKVFNFFDTGESNN